MSNPILSARPVLEPPGCGPGAAAADPARATAVQRPPRRQPVARGRLLIGILETAGHIRETAAALRAGGWDVTTLVVANPRYGETDYDRVIRIPRLLNVRGLRFLCRRLLLLAHFVWALVRCDHFLFVWNLTFLPLNLDLPVLRLLRKRVVMLNCGSDVRYRPIQDRLDCEVLDFDWMGSESHQERRDYVTSGAGFLKTFYFQKLQERCGCRIISSRNQATFLGRPCFLSRFPQRRLLDGPKAAQDPPLIVHAPSSRTIKGTRFVLRAIERLRAEGRPFEFRLLEGLPNAEVLATLARADIVVDQVGSWPARLAVEAMAAGCVVIGGNRPEYSGRSETPPVVPFEADADRLADSLARLIDDRAGRQRRMRESFAYWQAHYSPEAFVEYFDRVLDGSAAKLSPCPGQRELVRRFASRWWQRWLISLFY